VQPEEQLAGIATIAREGNQLAAQPKSLFKAAARIQARAIRCCGELLKEIAPNHGGRLSKETHTDAHMSSQTRSQAAAAGLSKHLWNFRTAPTRS
jgi:hypothetical protein